MCAGHYILQMQQVHQTNPDRPALQHTKPFSDEMLELGPPVFKLAGLAIGNGLTDPQLQVDQELLHCCILVLLLLCRAMHD